MQTERTTSNESTGLQALEGQTDPAIIPRGWFEDARRPPIDDGEEEFLPVLYRIERELADGDVLAGRDPGRPESIRVHVLYVSRDGRRRVDDDFQARVVETGDGTVVEPRGFLGRIGVDGDVTEPREEPVSPRIRAALATLHGCTLEPGAGE